jgi:type II secretory pathway pseudopilin PulG
MQIRNRCKGFTYIELALAMAIIAFVVLAFTQLFLSSSISIKNMQFQTLAYNFAGDKMEEIRNESFDGVGNPWYPNIWETESQTQSGKTFTRNVTISQLEASLKRIDIEVIWTEGGASKSIGVSSLVADKW